MADNVTVYETVETTYAKIASTCSGRVVNGWTLAQMCPSHTQGCYVLLFRRYVRATSAER